MKLTTTSREETAAYLSALQARAKSRPLTCHLEDAAAWFDDLCHILLAAHDGEEAYGRLAAELNVAPQALGTELSLYYREDLLSYLLAHGFPEEEALHITNEVRCGRARTALPPTSRPLPLRLRELILETAYLASRVTLFEVFGPLTEE